MQGNKESGMQLIDALNNSHALLAKAGVDTPLLDAEVLLANILGIKRIDLYLDRTKRLKHSDLERFNDFIARRCEKEPVAYITGTREFWSTEMKVSSDVLIPRPETEILVEHVLKRIPDKNSKVIILDICTGSGCIAMALAKELANATFTVTDISAKAVDIARNNTSFANSRFSYFTGDLFGALPNVETFDVITANPPYCSLDQKEIFQPEIIKYEPKHAVFSGGTGFELIEKIIDKAHDYLKPNGLIAMEIGMGQESEVKKLFETNGSYIDVHFVRDLSGIDRVVCAKRR